MKLKELRQQHGLSQTKLSKMLNIKRVTYNKYELGTNEPSLDTLKMLAKFYDVSLDYLCEYAIDKQINYVKEDRKKLINYLLNAPYQVINQIEIFLKGYNSGKSEKQEINFYNPGEENE